MNARNSLAAVLAAASAVALTAAAAAQEAGGADARAKALDAPAPAATSSRTNQPGPAVTGQAPKPDAAAVAKVAGTYRLQTLNGLDLPVQVGEWKENGKTCKEEVLSAAVQFMPDGTYTMDTLTRQNCGGQAAERENEGERGTWRYTGNALYLNEDRIEGKGSAEKRGKEYQAGIPIENLGGTGEIDGKRLSIGLEDGKSLAIFAATDAKAGPEKSAATGGARAGNAADAAPDSEADRNAMRAAPAGSAKPGTDTEAELPDQALAERRQGTIGMPPDPVRQPGAGAPDAEVRDTGTAELPEGSLPAKRRETIGTPPEPVRQGGGGGAN